MFPHLTPEVPSDLHEPVAGLLQDGLSSGVALALYPVQTEDDALALDGDVPGYLTIYYLCSVKDAFALDDDVPGDLDNILPVQCENYAFALDGNVPGDLD